MNTYSSHKDDALSAVKQLIKELQIDCVNVRDQLENIRLILIISVVLACCFAVIRFTRLKHVVSTTNPRKKKLVTKENNAPNKNLLIERNKHNPIKVYMPY